MKRGVDRFLLLLIGMAIAGAGLRAEPPAAGPFQDVLSNMMEAIVANDRSSFVGSSTKQFRSAMNDQQWRSLVTGMQTQLKPGYTLTYFGKIRQGGVDVFIYKMSFASGRDDILIKLAMSDQLVAGLWFL